MARIRIVLLLLGALLSLAAAASPRTFCKCTCFTNSTIIPLGPRPDSPPTEGGDDGGSSTTDPAALARRASSSSCAQCNRAMCLEYNLPICQGAEEKDVVTMCFQRDSRKDQIIVWGFILGTAGLLGWAAAQRVLESRQKGLLGGVAGGLGISGARSPGLGGGGGGGSGSGSGRSRGASGGGGLGGLGDLRSPRDGASRGNYRPVGAEGEGFGGPG